MIIAFTLDPEYITFIISIIRKIRYPPRTKIIILFIPPLVGILKFLKEVEQIKRNNTKKCVLV